MQETVGAIVREARLARESGETARAVHLYRDAASTAEALDDVQGRIHALRHVSELAREMGKSREAVDAAEEAVALCRNVADVPPLEQANALRVAALALEADGRCNEAHALWCDARGLYAAAGVPAGVAECETHL